MGFLDRLAADLIAKNTGMNRRLVRSMVRKAGGTKLLVVGGAALAGVLASERMGQGKTTAPSWPPPAAGAAPPPPPPPGAGASSGHVSPPPPPPPPGAPAPPVQGPPAPPGSDTPPTPASPDVPLPPLPGSPSGPPLSASGADEPPDPELPPELTYAVVRAMVAAALADGELAPEERQAVEAHLDGGSLSEEEIAQVRRDLVLPPGPRDLASLVDDEEDRALLFRFAALVLHADGNVSELERGWLGRLGAALGFAEERQRALAAEVAPAAGPAGEPTGA